jgi:hypothetical protein
MELHGGTNGGFAQWVPDKEYGSPSVARREYAALVRECLPPDLR